MIRQTIDMVKLRIDLYGVDRIIYDDARPMEVIEVFETFTHKSIGLAKVRVLAKPEKPTRQLAHWNRPRGPVKHRIEILCEHCSSWLPAGRIAQHTRRKDHAEAA